MIDGIVTTIKEMGALRISVAVLVCICIYSEYAGLKKRYVLEALKGRTPAYANTRLASFPARGLAGHPVLLFIFQMIPVCSAICMIMGFSSDTGTESSRYSRVIAQKAALWLNDHKDNSFIQGISRTITQIGETAQGSGGAFTDYVEHIIRKLAHMCEYALLALFVWAVLYAIMRFPRRWAYMWAMVCVIAIGIVDEYNQSSIIGRYGSPKDVIIDTFGAAVMLLVLYGFSSIMIKHYRRRLGG